MTNAPLRAAFVASMLLTAPAARAQSAPATRPEDVPPTVEIALGKGRFVPPSLTLHHGQRYILRLTNPHRDYSVVRAERFFADAKVVPSRMGFLDDGGRIRLRPRSTIELLITAPATRGTYRLTPSHFWHGGRRAAIVVD